MFVSRGQIYRARESLKTCDYFNQRLPYNCHENGSRRASVLRDFFLCLLRASCFKLLGRRPSTAAHSGCEARQSGSVPDLLSNLQSRLGQDQGECHAPCGSGCRELYRRLAEGWNWYLVLPPPYAVFARAVSLAPKPPRMRSQRHRGLLRAHFFGKVR